MPPQNDQAGPSGNEPQDDHARLQSRLADIGQELLQARDAAIGAEAELGVAKARVREVEFQLDVSTTEIDELRAKVLELSEALALADGAGPALRRSSIPRPVVSKRLSPLLARTARQTR